MKKWMFFILLLALCSCKTHAPLSKLVIENCTFTKEDNCYLFSSHSLQTVERGNEVRLPYWLDMRLPDGFDNVILEEQYYVIIYPSKQRVYIRMYPYDKTPERYARGWTDLSADEAATDNPQASYCQLHQMPTQPPSRLQPKAKASRAFFRYATDDLYVLCYNIKPEDAGRFKSILSTGITIDKNPPMRPFFLKEGMRFVPNE